MLQMLPNAANAAGGCFSAILERHCTSAIQRCTLSRTKEA